MLDNSCFRNTNWCKVQTIGSQRWREKREREGNLSNWEKRENFLKDGRGKTKVFDIKKKFRNLNLS